MWREFSLQTKRHAEFINITGLVKEALIGGSVRNGICTVYVPHTTAGVTINENADPDVATDIQNALAQMVPAGPFRHCEGNSPAHIKAALVGNSVTLPLSEGRLVLGTWQGVFFCEFDGPRQRRFSVGCVGE